MPQLVFHLFRPPRVGTVLTFFIFAISSASVANSETYAECIEDGIVVSEVFCLPRDYRQDVPPPMDGPINVFLKLPVSEISEINDQRSQISIRLTYKLQWPEPRMILNTSADWSNGEINVRADMVSHFWSPDIIIHDLVSFYKPEVLNEVAALEIKSDRKLYYKVRSDLTVVCRGMEFSRFPLDEHICYLKLTSFGYDDTRMRLAGRFSYESDNQRALPFSVVVVEIPEEQKVYHGSNSNYSVYGLELRLTRCVSPYLLNVYLPTSIFVVMSWVSFLIPTDVVPARIVLLVTLCLVIINTFNNVTARIPVASQVTALEIWLIACIFLVFGALAEYAFILRKLIRLSRLQQNQQASPTGGTNGMIGSPTASALRTGGVDPLRGDWQEQTLDSLQEERETLTTMAMATANTATIVSNANSPNNRKFKPPKKTPEQLMRVYQQSIDGRALTIFPVTFLLFNFAYWGYYLIEVPF